MPIIKQPPANQQGFALLEVSLAIVIAASVFLTTVEFLTLNAHRTSAERIGHEINQIFNAGISYYLTSNNTWPDSIQLLVDDKLLPAKALTNPWGYNYQVDGSGSTSKNTTWVVGTCLPKEVAGDLAALLPFGKIVASTQAKCGTTSDNLRYVTTSINQAITDPKHNLAAEMVKEGDKVGAPSCPKVGDKQYYPHIYLLPASFDTNGHPISAMAAYADPLKTDDPNQYPYGYWVAHLELTTDKGTHDDDGGNFGEEPAAIMAFTDCQPTSE